MEILPSLASLSGITLLISVLIVFVKIFDENHQKVFIDVNNLIDKNFTFPHDNPAWVDLRIVYDGIRNTDPVSLRPVTIASFLVLALIAIAFCFIFWGPQLWGGHGNMFLKIISLVIMGLYFFSAHLFRKMGIQKKELNKNMEEFKTSYKLLELAIKHEKKSSLLTPSTIPA